MTANIDQMPMLATFRDVTDGAKACPGEKIPQTAHLKPHAAFM